MKNLSLCSSEKEAERLIDEYSNLLFKLIFLIVCNKQDAEDVLQETIIAYLTKHPDFTSNEHEKA